MSDRAALLAAIRQFPDADTPRLVFADWLDEHGESERAEFIRVQIELAHRKARYDAGERPGLAIPGIAVGRPPRNGEPHYAFANPDGAVRGLLERWAFLWGRNGWVPARMDPVPWRGFVERLTCSAPDWLRHADAILAEHPVRRVRLTTVPVVVPGGDELELLEPGSGAAAFWGDEHGGYAVPDAFVCELALKALRERWPGIEFELPPAPAYQFSGVIQNWTVSTTSVTGGSILTGTNAGGGK